jgi:hypothetical protein
MRREQWQWLENDHHNKRKEATGTIKESDVRSRDLRKKRKR